MRPKGYCISMFVPHVGQKMAKPISIQKLNVLKIQKKND